jgi:hypothetical protein
MRHPDNIDPAGAIRARLARLPASASKPGTLSKWADEQNNEYWEFVGDGSITGTEFVERVIEREAEHQGQGQGQDENSDGEEENPLKSLVGNRPFAEHAAAILLGESNPNAPIAAGQVKELSLKQLVNLVSPFVENYAREYVAKGNGQGTTPDDHNRITGNVSSMGLTLPID